jgi:hypothetical protein
MNQKDINVQLSYAVYFAHEKVQTDPGLGKLRHL